MRMLGLAIFIACILVEDSPALAQDMTLEHILRTQAFNKAFEDVDLYHVTIETDHMQADGSREVTAVAVGKFLQNTKRMKVLFLLVGERIIGGQILEETGLPPCKAIELQHSSSSL